MAGSAWTRTYCCGGPGLAKYWLQLAFAGAMIGAVLVVAAAHGRIQGGSLPRVRPAAMPSAPLRLLSASVWQDGDYVTVAGEVSNRSGHLVRGLEVVLELFQSDGRCLAAEPAEVTSSYLPSGSTSTFQVTACSHGSAQRYGLRFREPGGTVLECVDAAPD